MAGDTLGGVLTWHVSAAETGARRFTATGLSRDVPRWWERERTVVQHEQPTQPVKGCGDTEAEEQTSSRQGSCLHHAVLRQKLTTFIHSRPQAKAQYVHSLSSSDTGSPRSFTLVLRQKLTTFIHSRRHADNRLFTLVLRQKLTTFIHSRPQTKAQYVHSHSS